MELEELSPNLIVQDGRQVLKVSTISANGATAETVYPVPARTTVAFHPEVYIKTHWKPVSEANYQRYVEAYSRG